MEYDKFVEIMEKCDMKSDSSQRIFRGLTLMSKYIPTIDIDAAERDKVYASCEVEDLLKAGITEDDTTILSGLRWGVEDGCYITAWA
jgi:hypothetical protein